MKGRRLANTLSCEVAVRGQRSAAHMWSILGARLDSQREMEDLHFQNAILFFSSFHINAAVSQKYTYLSTYHVQPATVCVEKCVSYFSLIGLMSACKCRL